MALLAFDIDLALENQGDRRRLATEMPEVLLENIPRDLDSINAAFSNVDKLKSAVCRLHSAVRHCEYTRITKASEKQELALKQAKDKEIPTLLSLLNGEVTTLNTWH